MGHPYFKMADTKAKNNNTNSDIETEHEANDNVEVNFGSGKVTKICIPVKTSQTLL